MVSQNNFMLISPDNNHQKSPPDPHGNAAHYWLACRISPAQLTFSAGNLSHTSMGIWDSTASHILTSATAVLGHIGMMPQAPERSRNVPGTIVHCLCSDPSSLNLSDIFYPRKTILQGQFAPFSIQNYWSEFAGKQFRSCQLLSRPAHLWLSLIRVLVPTHYVTYIVTIY